MPKHTKINETFKTYRTLFTHSLTSIAQILTISLHKPGVHSGYNLLKCLPTIAAVTFSTALCYLLNIGPKLTLMCFLFSTYSHISCNIKINGQGIKFGSD